MYLSDAFELVCLDDPGPVDAESGSCGLGHFDAAGLKSWSELIDELSAGLEPGRDLLIFAPQWLGTVRSIDLPDHLMESLESCQWDGVFLDYDLDSLEQEARGGDHARMLLNADSVPSRPTLFLIHRSRARAVFECLPDARNAAEAGWENLMRWMGFFSIDMLNSGRSFLLWPPLRMGAGRPEGLSGEPAPSSGC